MLLMKGILVTTFCPLVPHTTLYLICFTFVLICVQLCSRYRTHRATACIFSPASQSADTINGKKMVHGPPMKKSVTIRQALGLGQTNAGTEHDASTPQDCKVVGRDTKLSGNQIYKVERPLIQPSDMFSPPIRSSGEEAKCTDVAKCVG